TQKQIEEVPTETKKVGDIIEDLDNKTGAFGGQVGNLKARFTQAKEGIELAKGGFTGLKGAIASTGIGVLILALGALYEYFTKTDEGAEDLAAGMAGLKAVVSVLEGVVISAGRGLVMFFTDPLQAAQELGEFIGTNLLNRVKSFGVLWEAVKNGDTNKLADAAIQFTTGIENGTAKTKALGDELKSAAAVAYSLSRAEDRLDDAQRASLVTIEKNKNLIDQLVLSARDRSLSEAQRLANLDKAGKLETENLNTTTKLATLKLHILQLQNEEAERTGKITDEQRQAVAEQQAEVIRLAGQSATQQQAIANRRSALLQQESAEAKAARDKAAQETEKAAEQELANRRELLKLQNDLLDQQLRKVQVNSNEELNILQRKLNNSRDIELAQKNLTIGQLKLINQKYEQDSLELRQQFIQRQLATELENAKTLVAVQLAGVEQGSAQELTLRKLAIEQQLALDLAALDQRKDNAAKEKLLRANAAKEAVDLEFQTALSGLERELEARRIAVNEFYAEGKLTKQQQEDSLAAIERAGTQARLVALQQAGKNTQAVEAQIAQQDAATRDKKVADDKAASDKRRAYEDARLQTAQDATQGVIDLFGEESVAGEAALAFKKTLALGEIAINLSRELSAIAVTAASNPLNIPTAGLAGISQEAIYSALAIAKAAVLTTKVLLFEQGGVAKEGGVLKGPSHQQGGIPFRVRGRAGFEAEGDEIILAKGVFRNPALRAAASQLNVLGGGKSFVGYQDPLPPATWARYADGGIVKYESQYMDQMRGGSMAIDYDRLANAIAEKQVMPSAPEPLDYNHLRDIVVAGCAALPPNNLNIHELNRKQKGVTLVDKKRNI
ncbi:MAG TPA: hypothetical protein VF598_03375, partial [Hymenobacter sp.]